MIELREELRLARDPTIQSLTFRIERNSLDCVVVSVQLVSKRSLKQYANKVNQRKKAKGREIYFTSAK